MIQRGTRLATRKAVHRLGRAICACALALVWPVRAQDAATLKARDSAMSDALADSVFQRPLVLQSRESSDRLEGLIHARIDQPLSVVRSALHSGASWCDILILHLNVKQCRAQNVQGAQALHLWVGHKHDQPLDDAHRFAFAYRVVATRPDYLQLQLNADEGPLGTSDYRIVLEVAAFDAARSIIGLSYSYRFGVAARLAMQGYLATAGRDKVGFTVVGREADGTPRYVGGTRGLIERNTMRYYLAIEAYLGALALPAAQQQEKRLADWYSGSQRYPRQLHELERDEYLSIKRKQRTHEGSRSDNPRP